MIRRVVLILRMMREMIQEFIRDDAAFLAAGIAFYAFFSLFPLALISIAVLTYFLPDGDSALGYTVGLARQFEIPPEVLNFITSSFKMLGAESRRSGILGVLMLLWSGRQLFRAMEYSLHKAWEIPLKRNFIAANLLSMLLVILCASLAFGVGIVSAFLSWVQSRIQRLHLPEVAGFSLDQARVYAWIQTWIVVPVAIFLIFLLLYSVLPSKQVPLLYAVPGAVFSAVAWKAFSWVYVEFVVYFGRKSPVYGSIWGIIGLMIWLYIAACVFLLGAELVYVVLRREEKQLSLRRPRRRKKGRTFSS